MIVVYGDYSYFLMAVVDGAISINKKGNTEKDLARPGPTPAAALD